MADVQRSSDVVEAFSERAILAGIGGVVAVGVGAVLLYYGGMGIGLGVVLAVAGVAGIVYALFEVSKARQVDSYPVDCPYCHKANRLTAKPDRDFTCRECHRLVPVQDGRILRVFQVRCGFCNELNWYSEKSEGLLCESCNHEIPIATASGAPSKTMSTYAVQEDSQLYELVLIAHDHHTDDLINCLQHMLALNRNQVKDMLTQLPTTLLTGIPRKKAEMLKAQLSMHHGVAEFHAVNG
ncbi:MAG: hypothetical protein HONBIEJF_01708 [Fimbriimonadaceae bacterium]|nr:hypothetical protein [Fimbriimonadaceae bacterium]